METIFQSTDVFIKPFIEEVGKPQILQSDNGCEFLANIIKKFLEEEEGIIYINNSPYHPQTNGVVEAFNKNIINKLEYKLLDNNNSFDLKLSLNKTTDIYYHTVHTNTKIEPKKAINLKDENIIEQVIKNILNSQSNKLKIMKVLFKKVINVYLMIFILKKVKH